MTTHAELVARAGRWLRYSVVVVSTRDYGDGIDKVRCGVVLTECQTRTPETPDAIGWWCSGYWSILVEVKVSRADFLKDRKKMFRYAQKMGMGRFRYYLTTPGLIQPDELPDRWGLLESTGRIVKVIRHAVEVAEYAKDAEMEMMYGALRRTKVEVRP